MLTPSAVTACVVLILEYCLRPTIAIHTELAVDSPERFERAPCKPAEERGHGNDFGMFSR